VIAKRKTSNLKASSRIGAMNGIIKKILAFIISIFKKNAVKYAASPSSCVPWRARAIFAFHVI
jgi:hypothetical protein